MVFISHSPRDSSTADAIYEALGRSGVETVGSVDECEILLLVFSGNSNGSGAVLREVREAYEEGKFIIPLRIHNVTVSGELGFFLSGQRWLDIGPDEQDFDELIFNIHQSFNQHAWVPANDQKPMNMKKAVITALLVVVLMAAVSITFFFATGGMAGFDFDDYVSVNLVVDGTRVRVDVDRSLLVVDISYYDGVGMRLLYGFEFEEIGLSAAIFNLVSRAIDEGVLQSRNNVTTSVRHPRNPDEMWLALIEYDLHGLRDVLNQWLSVNLRHANSN
ncbi:MAG: toll/interleukin-1 receptor domain-containing protein [Defluviitaleaceae bacterium]|nr:toll/interleukin-1 receptor domain-containing protein [Defluviitaleaceae bacterium]